MFSLGVRENICSECALLSIPLQVLYTNSDTKKKLLNKLNHNFLSQDLIKNLISKKRNQTRFVFYLNI